MRDVEGYEERRKMIPKEGMPLVAGDHRANDTRSLVAAGKEMSPTDSSFKIGTFQGAGGWFAEAKIMVFPRNLP
jgi:hypothetical protein